MKKFFAVIALAASSFATMANAGTIFTFDEAGVANNSFFSTDGKVKAEYVWSMGTADGHSHRSVTGGNAFEAGHGQVFQGLRFSAADGISSLTLSSFDLQGTYMVGSLNNGTGTIYKTGLVSWATESVNFSSSSPIYIYAYGQGIGYLDNVTFNADVNAVPEPTSSALLLLGIGGLIAARRKSVK